MSELRERHCSPIEGGTQPFDSRSVRELLKGLKEWKAVSKSTAIVRSFEFKNFHQTMAFANAVAWIAHQEDHHPELELSYRRCTVRYSTHAINGLSINDFICASKIDALLS